MDDARTASAADLAASYGTVAVAMHWLLALLIVCTFLIGLSMVDLPLSPQRLRLFNWHKWLGVGVLVLSAAHLVFYALFFLVPLLGWAFTSAIGVPVVWFGVLPLPDFVPRDKPFGEEVLAPLHQASSYLLAAIVCVHVAAAFKHQFVDGDHLMARMWPWWPTRRRA